MNLTPIALKMGVPPFQLEQLITGQVSVGVAAKLGVPPSSLQEFVNGGNSIPLAMKIGCPPLSLQDVRTAIGERGSVGLIIGLLVGKHMATEEPE